MKLIKIEYLEESTKAIFFNVTYESISTWFSKSKIITKKAYLEKWEINGFRYSNNFQWSDNAVNHNKFDSAVIQEMILQYEKIKTK